MFVKQLMISKEKVVFVREDAKLTDALAQFVDQEIDGMPVVDAKDHYVGLLTKNTIYEASFKSEHIRNTFLAETTAGEIAKKDEGIVHVDEVFENALLIVKDIPIAVVVNDDREWLGIVTRFDVLEQFQSVFGMQKPGIRIAFTSIDSEGRIARLSDIAKQYHKNIISLTTFDETDKLIRRMVMKVENVKNIDPFISKLEKNGFRILSKKEMN